LLTIFFTSSNQAPIFFGSSQSFLWHSYTLPSLTSIAGVLFKKLLTYLTPTRGLLLTLQITSAISLIRDRVGDSP
jgi:Na+-translocating ferredoxin:NAD+ oxidoreductase RnfD subunit